MRADALATLYLFHPLGKCLASQRGRVPILMYHSVSDSQQETAHPYYRTTTSPEVFGRHMRYLHENGYSVVSPQQGLKHLEQPSVERPIVITFDDGFQDFYTHAFPQMSRYGFSATVYLPTDYIRSTPQDFKGIPCLTWNQVRELQKSGVEFGSHTVTHPQLKSLTPEQVRGEVTASKVLIEQELGTSVNSFAYPYAFPETDRRFASMLRGFLQDAGYENGVSTIIGTANETTDRFFLSRLPINGCDDDRLFGAKIEGGYNWLHALQYASKLVSAARQ